MLLRRLPARRAPDAGALLGRLRPVDLLPGQPRPVRPRARRDLHDPAARQAADDRGLRLQEDDRPAAALPRQHPLAHRELPADDLRSTGRRLRDRPDHGQGPRAAARAARRPRAELLDLDRPPRRAPRTPTSSRRSPQASTPCSAPCTAAPTRPSSRCSSRSRPTAATSTHFINRVKNKEPGVKLMGFGHRVYKNYDPRAAIIKETADNILRRSGMVDPLLDIALQLEQTRPARRLLRRAQALPERRLLHRPDLQVDGLPERGCSPSSSPSAGSPAGSPSGAR